MSNIDDKLLPMIPKFKVETFVSILAEVTDYNHRLMNIPHMWKTTRGAGVKIAVLDTGTPNHPDIKVSGSASMVPGYHIDTQGHGTHVCGITSAIAGNGMGVAGIAPEAELYTCAVLNGNGSGTASQIAKGIRWAVDEAKADIINMSLGMAASPLSPVIVTAAEYAARKGVIMIAAAGNDAGRVSQPACLDQVIAVAAVDENKNRAGFSNFGKQVEFASGGVQVYSTFLNNGYAKLSGTCLKKGTLIYTPDGPVPIEDVKVGDTVFAFKDGEIVERTVSANLYQGRNTVYQLVARGRSVWATATHPFLAVDTDKKTMGWVPLNELTEHHRLPVAPRFQNLAKWEVVPGTEHEDDVYDLTVPDADCFVANGLVVHNSMASPALTGLAALILSDAKTGSNPRRLTADELRAKLRKIAFDVGPQGWDPNFGWGIPVFGHSNESPVETEKPDTSKASCLSRYLAKIGSKSATPSAIADRLEGLGQDLLAAASMLRR